MSVVAVAIKDFQDAVRSRSLWALSALFLLFALGITYAFTVFSDATGSADVTQDLIFFMTGLTSMFVSLTAIIITYKAIAGERESGSIMLLLGLPHTRRDVVLGKVIGRTGVLAIPTLLGFFGATLLAFALLGTFDPVTFAIFVAVTVVFALTYVSLVVGFSAASSSTGTAASLAVGFFFVFEMLWGALTLGIVYVANGFELPTTMPDWVFVVNQIPPSSAYTTGLRAILPEAAFQGPSSDAVWATPWLGVAVLLFWMIVPLVFGYRRFERADL